MKQIQTLINHIISFYEPYSKKIKRKRTINKPNANIFTSKLKLSQGKKNLGYFLYKK